MSSRPLVLCLAITLSAVAGCDDGGDGFIDAAPRPDGAPFDAGVDDTTAPETTITEAPADPSNSATATFTLAADEDDATFECRVDDAAFAPCTSPHAVTLADGAHTFEARATDLAGNVDATPASHGWTIDTDPPETAIDAAPPTLDNSVDVSFEFSADEAGASFACSVDGAAFTACTSPLALTGLADGAHTFAVRATDAAGNVDPTDATHAWTIDSSTPDTQIDDGPTGAVATPDATFAFSSPDTAGATFACRLDGAAFAPCTSPRTFTGLADGEHTFEVRASDAVGNVDPTPATRTWTIDTVAPDTTIDSGPAGTVASAAAAFSFSASPATGAAFQCRLDGAAFAACTSPQSYTGLADGAHTFDVRACDAVGNCDASPATRTWTVDTTPPNTTIDSGPSGTVASTGASFTFSASPATGATFQCRLDGAAFAACTSPQSYSGLADGAHTFDVRACDAVGNCDASPATRTWTIDTAAPDTTIDSGPTGTVASATAAFSFSASPATGATFQCRLDGAAFAACTSPQSYSSLADGAHTFDVRACDAVGNCDASPATRTWTVDTTPPGTTIDSGPTGTVASAAASFSFSASPATGATFQCRLDGAAFAACTSPHSYSGLADGAHTFDVRACDAVGNCDASPATRTWTVDTTPPNTTIDSGPSGTVASTGASFTFSASPATGATFQCRLDGAAFAACTSPQSYSSLADGAHTFDVRACDAVGNCDASPATRAWTVDTTPPDTTIDSGPTGTVASSTAAFTFSASPATGATFQCRLDGAAFAACTSPQSYASVADGAHTFDVRACDAVGNCDASPATRTWTIDTTPPNTTIDSGPSGTVTSTGATFTFSASPATGATFQCRLDGAAFAGCTSPRSYASLADGAHTFDVRACDAVGNCDASPATRTWTVDTTPPDTLLTATIVEPWPVDYGTFTLAGSPSAATYQCSLDGAAFAACPQVSEVVVSYYLTHTFQARACDAVGNCDASPATFMWTPVPGLVLHLPLDGDLANHTNVPETVGSPAAPSFIGGEIGLGLALGGDRLAMNDGVRAMGSGPDRSGTVMFWHRAAQFGGVGPLMSFEGEDGCTIDENGEGANVCCRVDGARTCTSVYLGDPGDWRHVAIVYQREQDDLRVLVNGQWAGGFNPGGSPFGPRMKPLVLGEGSDPRDVDDVRVYNVALDDATVCELAAGNNGDGCYAQGPAFELHLDTPQQTNTGWWSVGLEFPTYENRPGVIDDAAVCEPTGGAFGLEQLLYYEPDLLFATWWLDETGEDALLFDNLCETCSPLSGLEVRELGDGLRVCAGGNPTFFDCVGITGVAQGQWHHLALRLRGAYGSGQLDHDDVELFIDGKLWGVLDVPAATGLLTNPSHLAVGGQPRSQLDELEIFAHRVSDERICALAMQRWTGTECVDP